MGYGVSCARPFARRRLSTRRPALVAMRARKPWVRARLILLGWKVRFMTNTWVLNRQNKPVFQKVGKRTDMT